MAEQEFVKIAEVGEVEPGTMTMVRLDRDQILLANVGGTFYAISNMCTHIHISLANCYLVDTEVICPFLFTIFSVVTVVPLSSP
nr:Rieske 2Fe-2S domain-containing protein [Chloroflexota bacterium]